MITIHRRLRRRLVFVLLDLAVLLFTTAALLAQIKTRSGDDIEAQGVFPDMAFFARGNLNVESVPS